MIHFWSFICIKVDEFFFNATATQIHFYRGLKYFN